MRFLLSLFALLSATVISAKDPLTVYNQAMDRLPYVVNVPHVAFAVPDTYDTRELGSGVIAWGARGDLDQVYKGRHSRQVPDIANGVFLAFVSPDFCMETFADFDAAEVARDLSARGGTGVVVERLSWGPFPIVNIECQYKDERVAMAYVGTGGPSGECLEFRMLVPQDQVQADAALSLWHQFLKGTEYVAISSDQVMNAQLKRYQDCNITFLDEEGNEVATNKKSE